MKSLLPFLLISFFFLASCQKDNSTDTKPVNTLVESVYINQKLVNNNQKIFNIPIDSVIVKINFSSAINPAKTNPEKFFISNSVGFDFTILPSEDNKQLSFRINPILNYYSDYKLYILDGEYLGVKFIDSYEYTFTTYIDSTPKFPVISDDELLTLVQQQTFKFFWDYAHPVSGLARERLGSGDVVTSGGSGFGVMAILVGIERGFITRQQGFEKLSTIVNFLNNSETETFHGAYPHWLNGSTGAAIAFSTKDNGADLVETAYLIQGLLTVREYFKNGSAEELQLCDTITAIWERVEWDWFRQGDQNVLYWHWSPNYGWDMNMKIQGWSECLIVYALAASSPTHSIPKVVYDEGWARYGAFPMKNGKSFYGITLPLSWDYGGPLFWAHYSFLGLDPRNLSDQYANYWEQNVAHSLINFEYCKANPKKYLCYSADCWGLTASDIPNGYTASEPSNDIGVIAPTAAISSIAYTPEQSLDAIRFFYYILGNKLWGNYGFYDAFDANESWWASSYIAIDQGPEICMIENYRTALLWNLFMESTEVQQGLTKLGFSY
ncbi:MAG TPA: beta-glucosidase [Marinilabiliales bacterium]|nr:MAG: beta-glucosidase [Bacteroidetes bacterium GWC2_40_13]OFX74407.1 MAG: beta-glucosidase [Bacteroidetes bacterium GWD2_40_43]OFX95180.1 MAG: beta-glucosidase [Bacteroidetes bacterium GWE2_40_63]OFY21072.1 MAG: beta-glucosidase [Bacteroidetes bacterium GWF2_40_13]OFZ30845.1 MAG: beta-glucosidase [Bacteroidetes bacterium RIFOXYC2_FULL_40_12]HAM97335.1 beta-glucosidase [Marinilabiliales bacterium]